MSEPTTTAPAVEPKAEEVKAVEPVVAAPAEETKPAETSEPVAAAEPETAAVAATEEKPVEPITSGVLGYKAPGLIKSLKFSKRYFWLGDEAVSTQSLSHYLRGTEAKVAHPVAAWSSQTGKGLLYLVKTEAEKANPHDIIPLADATDLHKASSHEFSFKIHHEKHTFKAANDAERNGWFVAIEQAIEEAKGAKEGIHNSEGYKESFSGLTKPLAVATGAAAVGATAAVAEEKKAEEPAASTEAAEPTETAARVNSTGSSSDEAKKEKKKSRSASRGKRNSIFGSVFGKKEDKAVETPAAETTEAAPAVETAAEEAKIEAAAPVAETAPVAAEAAPAVAETTEAKEEAAVAPKPAKRNSLFGSIYQKVRSPTHEKKESEVLPMVPAKDEPVTETAAPAIETTTEPPVIDVAHPENTITEAKAEEAAAPVEDKKVDTPKKEKESFLGTLLSKARAKSPSAKRDAKEASTTEAPALPPKEEPVTEAPKIEEPVAAAEAPVASESAVEEAAETPEPKVTAKESRRKSLFAGEGKKKLSGMFRRSSHQKAEKESAAAEKENIAPTAEEAAPAESTLAEPEIAGPSTTAEEKVEASVVQSPTIGDVSGEAISIGKPHESTPTVSATA